MVKNITETIKVPVSFLVDMKDVSDDAKKALIDYVQMLDGEEKSKKREELISMMPEKFLEEAKLLGASLPTDVIDLHMKLGDFLFMIFAHNFKPVQAPLAIKRHEKRLGELADILSKDEFDVPEDVKKTVSSVMSDEEKWKESQFSAFIEVGEGDQKEVKYLGLTSMGANFFTKIINAAIEAVGD